MNKAIGDRGNKKINYVESSTSIPRVDGFGGARGFE